MFIIYKNHNEEFYTCRKNYGLKNHISSTFTVENMLEFFENEIVHWCVECVY